MGRFIFQFLRRETKPDIRPHNEFCITFVIPGFCADVIEIFRACFRETQLKSVVGFWRVCEMRDNYD